MGVAPDVSNVMPSRENLSAQIRAGNVARAIIRPANCNYSLFAWELNLPVRHGR